MKQVRIGELLFFIGGAVFTTLAASSLYLLSVIVGNLPHNVFVMGLVIVTCIVDSFLYWDVN